MQGILSVIKSSHFSLSIKTNNGKCLSVLRQSFLLEYHFIFSVMMKMYT